jgi:integrase/recombinase XerD
MARGTPNFPLAGPLAPFEAGFLARLVSQGYVSGGIVGQRALVAHLDRWLADAGLTVTELTPGVVESFLRARAEAGYTTKLTEHGLTPLLTYLEELGQYSPLSSPATPVDEVIRRFHQHLAEERGLGDATAANYLRVARQFLSTRPAPLDSSLAALAAADVSKFILGQSGRLSVHGMQTVVQGLRALLKFLTSPA